MTILRGPLARALAVVAALGVLGAACGGDGGSGGSGADDDAAVDAADCPLEALEAVDPAAPVEVVVWHSLVTKTQEALEDLAAQYNASQDRVEVRVEQQASGYAELQRKFNAAIPSGELPAIALLEDDQTQFLADSGAIVPASACLAAGGEDHDWLSAVESNYTIDGVLWPSGFSVSTPVLYYLRSHFEQAGLDPDDPPETLDELRASAEAIAEADVADVQAPFAMWLEPLIVESWLTGAGQEIVNEGNGRDGLATEATFDSGTSVEVLTWIQDMYDDGLLSASADTDGQVDHLFALANERASFTIEMSVAATSIEAFLRGELDTSQLTADDRVIVDDDLDLALDPGVALLPGVDEPGQAVVAGNGFYITNTGAPEVVAASWDFLEFMASVPAQVEYDLVGSYTPANQAALDDPELQDVWDTTLSGRWLALAYEQVAATDADQPGPSVGPGTELRQILRTELDRLLFEGASPEDVAASVDEQLDEALVTYEDQSF